MERRIRVRMDIRRLTHRFRPTTTLRRPSPTLRSIQSPTLRITPARTPALPPRDTILTPTSPALEHHTHPDKHPTATDPTIAVSQAASEVPRPVHHPAKDGLPPRQAPLGQARSETR